MAKEHPYYPYPASKEDLINGIQTTVWCNWMALVNAKMRAKVGLIDIDHESLDSGIAYERDCLDWFNKKFGLEDPNPLNKKNN